MAPFFCGLWFCFFGGILSPSPESCFGEVPSGTGVDVLVPLARCLWFCSCGDKPAKNKMQRYKSPLDPFFRPILRQYCLRIGLLRDRRGAIYIGAVWYHSCTTVAAYTALLHNVSLLWVWLFFRQAVLFVVQTSFWPRITFCWTVEWTAAEQCMCICEVSMRQSLWNICRQVQSNITKIVYFSPNLYLANWQGPLYYYFLSIDFFVSERRTTVVLNLGR